MKPNSRSAKPSPLQPKSESNPLMKLVQINNSLIGLIEYLSKSIPRRLLTTGIESIPRDTHAIIMMQAKTIESLILNYNSMMTTFQLVDEKTKAGCPEDDVETFEMRKLFHRFGKVLEDVRGIEIKKRDQGLEACEEGAQEKRNGKEQKKRTDRKSHVVKISRGTNLGGSLGAGESRRQLSREGYDITDVLKSYGRIAGRVFGQRGT